MQKSGTNNKEKNGYFVTVEDEAELVDCKIHGPINIDKYSMAKNCYFYGYTGIGRFSFLRNTDVGRHAAIGSRISIGGFNHPVNWLSVGSFQYRDTFDSFGENLTNHIELNENINKERTILGHDSWIGDNVFVKRGVKIGIGSIVVAGSVIINDVPDFTIYGGNPAVMIKKRFNDDLSKKILATKWWELSITELDKLNLPFNDPERCTDILNQYRKSF